MPSHRTWAVLAALVMFMTGGSANHAARAAARAEAMPHGVVYTSPLPGARLVSANTAILVRFDQAVATHARRDVELVVTGAVSGLHDGSLEVLEAGDLLRFTPSRPFAAGERVTVRLRKGASDTRDHDGASRYSFDIAASRPQASFLRATAALEAELGTPAAAAPPPPAPASSTADTSGALPPTVTTEVTGYTGLGSLFMVSFPIPIGRGGDTWLLAVDNQGFPIFQRRMDGPCFDFKPNDDGLYSYFDLLRERYVLLDASFNEVGTIQCDNGYVADLHELRRLPNGHSLLMSYDPEVVDMSRIVPGGRPDAIVFGLIVQELDETGRVVFQWRSWDHFEITDATYEDLTAERIDYVHGNAIETDPDGNLIVSCRHMDEVTKIDRRTGDILWRWGGKHNEFQFLGDTLQFSHQHAIRRLADGHFTMFDNGNFHSPQFSRAVEYEMDEAARTVRAVWEYRHSPDIVGGAMGYVQRLPNGNTLIGWGTAKPDVTELQDDGLPALTASLPDGLSSYRSYRYPLVGWANHGPTGPGAGAPAAGPRATMLSPGRPNPFRQATEFAVTLPAAGRVSLKVYDLQGREVATVLDGEERPAGPFTAHVDLADRAPGVYVCRLVAGGSVLARTVVKTR
jgi:hypothetical protein